MEEVIITYFQDYSNYAGLRYNSKLNAMNISTQLLNNKSTIQVEPSANGNITNNSIPQRLEIFSRRDIQKSPACLVRRRLNEQLMINVR